MAWNIVPDHGRLYIRATLDGQQEIEELIAAMQTYLTMEEYRDGHVHPRPAPASDPAAVGTGNTEPTAKATGQTSLNVASGGGGSDGTACYSTAPKVAGGPIEAKASYEAPEVTRHTNPAPDRRVPRFD